MHHIAIQVVTSDPLVPKKNYLRKWANATLNTCISHDAELTIRIVDQKEMAALNSTYRQKTGPTNVLSFPLSGSLTKEEIPLLGDIVICAAVVNQEAKDQHKQNDAHWAHMVVHGIFHLLGFDHVQESDAATMESLEVKVMQTLGFDNPYDSRR